MSLRNFARKHFQNFLGRVYKNYQGQVAIFVALIFQVVFILFALMINVGLLVHHKINLQQSADLAAYYGAMKQAEMLNVVSHVNFQIRQAYKLLTWRYRILGTFGISDFKNHPSRAGFQPIDYPIIHTANPSAPFSFNSLNRTCPAPVNATGLELPFLCMSHYGFKEYQSPPNDPETLCKADCGTLNAVPNSIPKMYTGSSSGAPQIINVIDQLNNAMQTIDNKIAKECSKSGPISLAELAKFYLSYLQDTQNKMLFIKMLLANLSANEADMLDLEGKSVAEGVVKTFRNNLSEANNTSIRQDNEVQLFNSISENHGGECSYKQAGKANPPKSGSSKLFAEINFAFIQYFILRCEEAAGTKNFKVSSIFDSNNMSKLDPVLESQLKATYPSSAQQIADIMTNNYYKHTVGIEKNPHCGVYYGVKASSTPVIPFLPIGKFQLNAIAFAKPFGGSVGPRHKLEWTTSDQTSKGGFNQSAQTDKNLPLQDPDDFTITSLKDLKNTLLNYSNYVGDTQGLSDPLYVGMYHDMLMNRSVSKNDTPYGETTEPTAGTDFKKPEVWPAYSEWNNLSIDLSKDESDLVAHSENHKNSYMRDIEISVVAPNQFETTYYSIEPDFYNVYVKNKLGEQSVLEKLKGRAGLSGHKVYVPKDFGDNKIIASNNSKFKNFSVKNQLEIVQHVLRGAPQSNSPNHVTYGFYGPHHAQGINAVASMYFTFVPFNPGSLLTSWTMKDLVTDDYSTVTQSDTKMPFAQCLDHETGNEIHGSNGYGSISEQADPRGGSDPLPPIPGNCITGGRTGYSVKIVSPAQLLSTESELTIGGQKEPLLNPPTEFLRF